MKNCKEVKMASRSKGRPIAPEVQALIDKLKRYRIDDSFFVPGASRADVEFLRKPAHTQGIGIAICQVALDEIYQQAGVRVFRKEGAYDEL